MKTKPILFSTEMVEAILEGKKIQTRRIVKHDLGKLMDRENVKSEITDEGLMVHFKTHDEHPRESFCGIKNPHGKIDDILWVREAFTHGSDSYPFVFKANYDTQFPSDIENIPNKSELKWKPSIYMPKEACRIFLKITNIRVERLHSISRGDAMSEGCPFANIAKKTNPVAWFAELWQKINGEESWNNNPWVWVIDFERA